MRSFTRLCGIAAALLISLGISPSASAEVRALLAGSWQFHSPLIPDLEGTKNDLAAMETLIRGEGAQDVTVLRNDQVTRTGFETALHALGLRAKKGDWIFIYYSGHGAEAEAAVKGTADGDHDQFLPLPGFDFDHQDAEHFIVDKDLYTWVARYVPRDVQVFMMADACHSGTMHRSIDKRAWHFTPRLAFRATADTPKLVARPAPQFPSVLAGQDDQPSGAVERADLPNEIYIGAAKDDQFALEAPMPAEGAPSRGMLTYSFEMALTQKDADGKTLVADADKDGQLTVGELASYLNSQVRMLTADRQETTAHYMTGVDKQPIFKTILTMPAPAPTAKLLPAAFVVNAGTEGAQGWRPVPAADHADFVWDGKAGTVLRRSGDMVAEKIDGVAGFNGVVEKWAAIDALTPLVSEARAKLVIGPGPVGARYGQGTIVHVGLDLPADSTPRYLTVFDLASDGTVQPLYPTQPMDGDGLITEGKMTLLDTRAVPPFGTDHVIALVTPLPPVALRQQLRVANGQRGAERLVAPIKSLLSQAGAHGALSIGALYTGAE